MTRDALLTRAQVMLGTVSSRDEALTRALDELERERDRARSWDWRAVCAARMSVLRGACTTSQAAARMRCTARTLRGRWQSLRLSVPTRSLAEIIQQAIHISPGSTDEAIAAALREAGHVHTSRVVVMRARHAAGIEGSVIRRHKVERDEVAAYLRDYDWMTARDILAAMRADGWGWRLDLRRIERHVQTLRP